MTPNEYPAGDFGTPQPAAPEAGSAGAYLPPSNASSTVQPLSPSEERTWAMIAHLSILVNLFTGFVGPIVSFLIYIIFRDRSRYVAYHALQSTLLQLIVWVCGGVIIGIAWVFTAVLSVFVIGLFLLPFTCILSFVPLIAPFYGMVGAIKTSQGEDFKYWLIGDWVRSTLTGLP